MTVEEIKPERKENKVLMFIALIYDHKEDKEALEDDLKWLERNKRDFALVDLYALGGAIKAYLNNLI